MQIGFISAIFTILFILQFISITYVSSRIYKPSSSWLFIVLQRPRVELNMFSTVLLRFLLVFSPVYILLIFSCLCISQSKGGFFMRQSMDYLKTLYFLSTFTLIWFIFDGISLLIDHKLFFIFGPIFTINGFSMLISVIWLFLQKRSYELNMAQIWWENYKFGRKLSRKQAHAIFEIQKHKRIVANPELHDAFDRYGRPKPHYIRAIHTNQYYEMEKSLHELERNAPIEVIENSRNEMTDKCKKYVLKQTEIKKFGELARLNCVLPKAEWKSPYLTLDYNTRRAHSYTDLRRDSDAPPSYKTSTSCSTSLCEVD